MENDHGTSAQFHIPRALYIAGMAVVIFFSELIDDLREHPVEAAKPISLAVYLGSMLYFDVPIWKALTVTTILTVAMLYHFGTRRLIQFSALLLLITLMSWIGWLPSAERLRETSNLFSTHVASAHPR
jgi:hypothetical protein